MENYSQTRKLVLAAVESLSKQEPYSRFIQLKKTVEDRINHLDFAAALDAFSGLAAEFPASRFVAEARRRFKPISDVLDALAGRDVAQLEAILSDFKDDPLAGQMRSWIEETLELQSQFYQYASLSKLTEGAARISRSGLFAYDPDAQQLVSDIKDRVTQMANEIASARQALTTGDFTSAIKHINQAWALEVNNPEVLQLMYITAQQMYEKGKALVVGVAIEDMTDERWERAKWLFRATVVISEKTTLLLKEIKQSNHSDLPNGIEEKHRKGKKDKREEKKNRERLQKADEKLESFTHRVKKLAQNARGRLMVETIRPHANLLEAVVKADTAPEEKPRL